MSINKKTDYKNSEKKFGAKRIFSTIIGLVLVIFIVSAFLWIELENKKVWQAVFLTNNQVYFGKLSYRPFYSTASLEDIYYLQVSDSLLNQPGDEQKEIKIIKFGNEIHAPKDKIIIPKSQILYWEDLREDSPIVKAILEKKNIK